MESKRNVPGDKVVDPNAIANYEYNNAAGAKKIINVGPKLHPHRNSGTTWTTDATTALALPRVGRSIAVYNNSGTVGSITFGMDNTVTVLAAGVVDNANGHVGIPCKPNDWTYLSGDNYQFFIASSANLMCFLIGDDSYLENDPNDDGI